MSLMFLKENDPDVLKYPAGTYSQGNVHINYRFDADKQLILSLKENSFTKSELLTITAFLLAAHKELTQ